MQMYCVIPKFYCNWFDFELQIIITNVNKYTLGCMEIFAYIIRKIHLFIISLTLSRQY